MATREEVVLAAFTALQTITGYTHERRIDDLPEVEEDPSTLPKIILLNTSQRNVSLMSGEEINSLNLSVVGRFIEPVTDTTINNFIDMVKDKLYKDTNFLSKIDTIRFVEDSKHRVDRHIYYSVVIYFEVLYSNRVL